MATSKVDPGDPDPALSRFEIEIQHFYVPSSVVKAKNAHRFFIWRIFLAGMFLFVCLEVEQCLSMYGQWSGVL